MTNSEFAKAALPLIAEWAPTRRWYPLKGRDVGFDVVARVPLGDDAAVFIVRADDTLLQVPVAVRQKPGPAPIGRLPDGSWLVDACYDAEAVNALVAQTDAVAGPIAAASHVRVIAGEQSNTSIIGEGAGWIAKVFRVLAAGENPDVEITEALTRARSAVVPALLGSLHVSWAQRDLTRPGHDRILTGHAVAVCEYLAGARDAWQVFVDDVTAVLEGEQSSGMRAAELGAAVAEVHATLADSLGTRTASADDATALARALEHRLDWAAQAAVSQLAPLADRLEAHRASLANLNDIGQLQRIHGDLHLGQVLIDDTGHFRLLDFEGEPLRPMRERAALETPLRDVVGMLRSIDYAGGYASVKHRDANDLQQHRVRSWVAQQQREFLSTVFPAAATNNPLLIALTIDKALYEVVYEVRNRPDWVAVPLAALERLLPR